MIRSILSHRHRALLAPVVIVMAGWLILSLINWSSFFNGARFSTPWNRYGEGAEIPAESGGDFLSLGYGQAFLFGGAVQIPALLGVFALHAAAMALGYVTIIRPVWGKQNLVSKPWLAVAALVPGSLMLIAATRLVTLFAPHPTAPGVIAILAALACAWCGRELWAPGKPLPSLSGRGWISLGLAFVATLIFSVHVDLAHVMGEGSVWFINAIMLSPQEGIGSGGRLPIIPQHYDELAFLYPVVYGLITPDETARPTLTVIYWLMLAAGRLGILSLIYVSVRGLRLDRLTALLLVAFVGFASLSLNPASSAVLFDSLSPLFYVQHVGRALIPVLPFVLLSALAQGQRLNATSIVAVAVMGIGLASMPVHVLPVLAWGGALALMTAWAPSLGCERGSWKLVAAFALVTLVAFSVAYSASIMPDAIQIGALLLSAAGGAGLSIWMLVRAAPTNRFRDTLSNMGLGAIAVLCAGAAVGLLTGNMLMQVLWPALKSTPLFAGIPLVDRATDQLASVQLKLAQSPFCEGYYWHAGRRYLTGHCGSLPDFARTYGLPLVAMAGAATWMLLRPDETRAEDGRTNTLMLWGVILCLMAYPLAAFLFDFLSEGGDPSTGAGQLNTWLRSRLLEPWFYSGLLIAACMFLRDSSAPIRFWSQTVMIVAVAIFALNPFTLPAQMVANTAYILDAVKEAF